MKSNFKLYDKYILRKPFLPLSFFEKLNNSKNIFELLETPFLRENIFLSSNSVYYATYIKKEKSKKLKMTLYKYLSRFSTRATPLNTVSNVSIQEFNSKKKGQMRLSRKTRLNYNALYDIVKEDILDKKKYEFLAFSTNPTIYLFENYYRFQNFQNLSNRGYTSNEKVEFNQVLSFITKEFKIGQPYRKIQKIILSKFGEQFDNLSNVIDDFLFNLIKVGFLVSELEPNSSSINYFDFLLNSETLKVNYPSTFKKLNNLNSSIKNLDLNFTNSNISYEKISKNYNLKGKHDFHIDSFDGSKYQSNTPDVNKLKKVLQFLDLYSSNQISDYIDKFKSEFNFRYQGNTKKICEIFDEEYGLTFDKNKFYDFDFLNIKIDTLDTNNGYRNEKQYVLLSKYLENDSFPKIIDINDHFSKAKNDEFTLDDEFSFVYEEYYNEDYKYFIKYAVANSQTNLISRFTQNNRKFLNLKNELTKENNCFDIRILENLDNGNIYNNLLTKEKTLDFNKRHVNQVELSDLTISIESDKIYLKHKEGQNIVPKLSNALNYTKTKSRVFRFLAEFDQYYSKKNYSFDWDSRFYKYSYLPRIIYNDIIIKKGCWILKYDEYDSLSKIKKWAYSEKLPINVSLLSNDLEVALNLANSISYEIILNELKTKKVIFLYEYLFNVKNGEKINNKSYSNEKLAFIYNES